MTTTMHEKFDQLLEEEGDHECEGLGKNRVCVRVVAMAELPTRFGDFHIVAFENNRDGKEHVAITKGDVVGASNVPVHMMLSKLCDQPGGSSDVSERPFKKLKSMVASTRVATGSPWVVMLL